MRPVGTVQEEVPQKQGEGLAAVPSVVVQTGAARQMQVLVVVHELAEVDKVLNQRLLPLFFM